MRVVISIIYHIVMVFALLGIYSGTAAYQAHQNDETDEGRAKRRGAINCFMASGWLAVSALFIRSFMIW